jgi:hypothetical protein
MNANRAFTEATLVLVLVLTGVANAIEVKSCDPDNKKAIAVVLDGKTNSVSRYFCVIANSDISKLIIDSVDLTTAGKEAVIDQGNIRLAQETGLRKGQPTKVLINITGFSKAGIYHGSTELRAVDMAPGSGARFTIDLTLTPKPSLAILPAANSFQLVSCEHRWVCSVFGRFASSALVAKSKSITIVNQTRGPVQVESVSLAVRGDHSGDLLTDSSWTPDQRSFAIPEGKTATVNLKLPDNRIESDKYQGSLRIVVKDLDDPLITNMVLSVRDGPILPLAVIVVGILLGRLVQLPNNPRLQTQMKLLQYFYILQYAARSINDPDAQRYLAQKFADARESVELAGEMDIEASQKLDSIRTAIELWSTLQNTVALVDQVTDAGRRQALQAEVSAVRLSLLSNNLVDAQTKLSALQSDVQQAIPALGGGAAEQTLPPVSKPDKRRVPSGLEKWLLYLSGGLPVNAETAYRYIVPFGYILLLICLIAFGYYNYYVRNGDTLGAGGLSDYLSLFLWGFSVDIAQRTLQFIPSARN